MNEERHCSECGGELPADAPQGLCPQCLMKLGLPTGAEAEKAGYPWLIKNPSFAGLHILMRAISDGPADAGRRLHRYWYRESRYQVHTGWQKHNPYDPCLLIK